MVKRPAESVPNVLLRRARERQGWTQEEVAEKIGTTCVTISRWESGATSPSRYFHKRLSALYGQSIQGLGLISEDEFNEPVGGQHVQAVDDMLIARRCEPVFIFNEPLMEAKELYGRQRERAILINRTYRKASTSIIGPRRIGKTWLVKYLHLVAPRELGACFSMAYLDATMPSCQTMAGFIQEVLAEFKLPVPGTEPGLIDLERGLKALKVNGKVPILCIDEFEGFSNRQEFSLEFFRALRAMTQTCDLVLVAVSRISLRCVIGKDVETSGFFNIFEQSVLAPFNREEAQQFIQHKREQGDLTQQECDLLWRYGEEGEQTWPPLRLQLVGKMLLEERGQHRNDLGDGQKFAQRLEETYREVVY